MAKSTAKNTPQILDRMTQAHLGEEFALPLNEIKWQPELYRHRSEADLDPKKGSMEDLRKNLVTDGQRDPILVFRNDAGAYVGVAGHRRRAAMAQLAGASTAGFSLDMPVRVREILAGSVHDYLLWSVADNVVRESIDEYHRIEAAITALKLGTDHIQIKVNMRLSDTTFDRYRRLAESPWMLEHVRRDEVGLTNAHQLLEAAGGNGGRVALTHLRADLGRLIAIAEDKIESRRAELAGRNKQLTGAEARVRNSWPRPREQVGA